MKKQFDTLGSGIKNILSDLQRLEADKKDKHMRDQRVGSVDYDLHA